jgi:YggT family protein
MAGSLQEGLIYLVKTLFDLYLFVLIIRFILAGVKADFFNPITQVAVRLTNPIVKPLRKVIPNFRNVEWAP